jgi:hypothetical protein
MKKAILIIVFSRLFSISVSAQGNQQKAQELVVKYLHTSSGQNINFNQLKALRSSYTDTKDYKKYLLKIDSLKQEGKLMPEFRN